MCRLGIKSNRMKINLLLMIAWLLAQNLTAAPVDVATATGVAVSFITSLSSGRLAAASTGAVTLAYIQSSKQDASVADYYVFNASDGSAFVIVAGDDRVERILAYGQGSLDMTHLPCNVQCWLDLYRDQMEMLSTNHAVVGMQSRRSLAHEPIAPLLTCRWDQISPYNRMCPEYNGSHCVTGCVATAMAQVMYYWQFPDKAPALPAYSTSTRNIHVPALPGDTLRWDAMLDTFRAINYTDQQADAVALLMRYCGQSVLMDYGPGTSGAFTGNVVDALRAFGYNRAVTMLMRYNYGDSLWIEMIHEQLMAGCPILYTADNVSGTLSHAFVLDGFDGSRYHINWGWGGMADGYFALDAFASGLNYRHGMFFQIFPDGKNGIEPAYDFEVDGIFYKLTGETARVTNGPNDYCGEIVIPDAVTHDSQVYPVTAIGPGAFAHSPALTSVVIGGQVSMVGDNAFDGCTALKRVALPVVPVTYHHHAFAGCTSLDTVDLADIDSWLAADFLDDEASPMYNAHHLRVAGKELTHVDVPEGIVGLKKSVFRNCQSLQSVTLPASVTSIGSYAFYRCTSLTQVTLGDGLQSMGYCAFAGCKRLARIDLPASLHTIDRYAFKDCEHLEYIHLPEAVTAIGGYTFNHCTRLSRVTLGASLDSIGYYAFMGCAALDTIICKSKRPPRMSGKSCFGSAAYANAVLAVPRASLGYYQHDEFWGRFSHIECIDLGAGPLDLNNDGEVNVADVNLLIDLIIAGTGTTSCDVNGDGELNISDINFVIDSIFYSNIVFIYH